jgi:oligosaccharide repeat unit polymerase
MFSVLIWAVVAIVVAAMFYAYTVSRDVFHPLMFIGPMMIFMYAWMPANLDSIGGLDGFFQRDQLDFVQGINVAGIACFVLGCLSVSCKLPKLPPPAPQVSATALVSGGALIGFIGLSAWVFAIVNVGGFSAAFSESYAGGWDDNGYIRDASLLLFPAFLLIMSASFLQGFRILNTVLLALFIAPWAIQAALTARRGPAFMIIAVVAMGWYLNRGKRPALILMAVAGPLLGFLLLFLVTNRQNIYLGSDRDVTADVGAIVEKPDTGNEYIYGAGGILSSEQRNSFYWGRRYLAQVLIRPIPHNLWPTKYEDFGLAEMTHNAGTGEGFEETLGWQGAVGSAPGIIADLWMEFHWLNLPVLFLLGRFFGSTWRSAQLVGGVSVAQYVIMAALSIYFVMQTMEAVIFRLLILSLPLRFVWFLAREPQTVASPVSALSQAPATPGYKFQ